MAVAVLAACGRLNFDNAGACVPVGHDEDGDAIDDACDVCPHEPDAAQRDSDGDGVGDACDLEPQAPRQRWALFDPFTSQTAAWQYGTGVQIANDALRLPGGAISVSASLNAPPAVDLFELAGPINGVSTSEHQVTLGIRAAADPASYFCELYELGTLYFAATYTTGTGFPSLQQMPLPGTYPLEEVRITLENTPPTWRCRLRYGANDVTVGGDIPMGITPDIVLVSAKGVDIDLRYFARITTQ
jgi:hypothetical protein